MMRAVGTRNAPNFQNVALMNWARIAGVRIGQESFAGWALFVEAPKHEHDLCRFVIEHRGPGWPPVRIATTYLSRQHHERNRRTSFRQMVTLFCRLTGQTLPRWETA